MIGAKVEMGSSGSMFLKTKENKFNKTIPSKSLNNYLLEKMKKEQLINEIFKGGKNV